MTTPPTSSDDRRHLFAEHTSRYDLRCVYCGRTSLNAKAGEPCPKAAPEPRHG